jgi:hypothetical protein
LRRARRLALRNQQIAQLAMAFGVEGLCQVGSRRDEAPRSVRGVAISPKIRRISTKACHCVAGQFWVNGRW